MIGSLHRLSGVIGVSMLPLVSCACAHAKDDATVCPEYRHVRCLSDLVCSTDKERSCRVCRCESALGNEDERGAKPPSDRDL